jgi:hypothetical protein
MNKKYIGIISLAALVFGALYLFANTIKDISFDAFDLEEDIDSED